MHIGPQGGMFKVWVHAWERRFHGRILRCPESAVNALAGTCQIPSYTALAASSIMADQDIEGQMQVMRRLLTFAEWHALWTVETVA